MAPSLLSASSWAAAAVLLCVPFRASALDNGVGRRPLMGYSTWNDMGCEGLSSAAVRATADALVSRGLAALGYRYLNVDDCWALPRRVAGALRPDPNKFPEGMAALAGHLHARGLRFGLYTDRGMWTCGAKAGSEGHETQDAQDFASWGVDFLKEDSCNAPGEPRQAIGQFALMRDALNATGRRIHFALCGWDPWYAEVGRALGNSWRVARDVNGFSELWNAVAINSRLARYAGPGAWNDPDGLIGSSKGSRVHLGQNESRMQFSLWAVMAAPLVLGGSPARMSKFDLATYSNEEVIAVSQDALGRQGAVAWQDCPVRNLGDLADEAARGRYSTPPACVQLWARPLLGGDVAVLLANWGTEPATASIRPSNMASWGFQGGADVRDLWAGAGLGVRPNGLYVNISGHSATMYRLRPSRLMV